MTTSGNNQLIRQLATIFLSSESNFFHSRTAADRSLITLGSDYSVLDSYHAGEFLLLLAGLKPVVLVYLPGCVGSLGNSVDQLHAKRIAAEYIEAVWRPMIERANAVLVQEKLDLELVSLPAEMSTPHTPSLETCYLCVRKTAPDLPSDLLQRISQCTPERPLRVDESVMATLLNYPSSLPETDPQIGDDYRQVSYVLTAPNADPNAWDRLVLTAFVASGADVESGAVQRHFSQHEAAVRQTLGGVGLRKFVN
ncbi:hypothetical protein DFS34DRAFT_78328 [Phlyctochytrium arcticum]|nr:hypothetical protein DFS34DRAFT_78328 [Phlyctochytrium arcticum]